MHTMKKTAMQYELGIQQELIMGCYVRETLAAARPGIRLGAMDWMLIAVRLVGCII